jgi:hypothetical protein
MFWFCRCVFRPHCRRVRRRNRLAVGCPPYVLVLPMRFGDPVVGLRRRYSPRKPGGRLPTLRCQHVLAFLPNSFGFLMHRGGRDARVPVLRRCVGKKNL